MAKATAGKSKAIVPWKEKFMGYARDAKEQVQSVAGGGIGVSFGHGEITVGGNPVKGGKLECVVLGYCALNTWYKTKYNSDDKQPPDCYAFAIKTDDPDMAPHKLSADPQSEKCADCPHNVFGTADTGRGKACGNNVRLGLFTAADAADAKVVSTAEMATGKVSPTNLTRWKAYVDLLDEEHGRPPWAVVTEIQSLHDNKTQIRLEFRMVELIEDDDVLTALEKRFLKVQDALQKPYSKPTERKDQPGGKAAGASRKFAGGKGARK